MNCNEILPNRPVDVDEHKSKTRKPEKKKKSAEIVEEIPHNVGMESDSEDEIVVIQHRDRFKKGEEDIESSTDETENKEIEEVVDVPIVNQQIELNEDESEDEEPPIELNEDESEDEELQMESNELDEEESSIEFNEDESEDEELQVESKESDDEESQIYERKSRRIRNPPNILTYDEIGEPVIRHR